MKYTDAQIKTTLRVLCVKLTRVNDRINWGGCGVMAAIVGAELECIGVTVDIVTPRYDPENTPAKVRPKVNNTNDVYDWDDNGLRRSHLAVRFRLGKRLYTWDSDKLNIGGSTYGKDREHASPYPFGQGLTVRETKLISATPRGWNTVFDRSSILQLRRIIRAEFKALEQGATQ